MEERTKGEVLEEARDRGFFTVTDVIDLLIAEGDTRTRENLAVHVSRAKKSGWFPGAEKLNRGQTSPWMLPHEEVLEWLEFGAPQAPVNGER